MSFAQSPSRGAHCAVERSALPKIGYKLCGEEQSPQELIAYGRRAEEFGFEVAMISDHFQPWIDRQGQSSFVCSVFGGLAEATERITIGTVGACPTIRTHIKIKRRGQVDRLRRRSGTIHC